MDRGFMSTLAPEQVEALKASAQGLEVEDILDLCFAFAKDPRRLTVYLDVLRRKGGQKAQAGACLICFDLAHRGNAGFEREFLALVPVMREFLSGEKGKRPLDALIEDDPYLNGLVAELERRLAALDPRREAAPPPIEIDVDADAIEIDLLSDQDFEIDLDEEDLLQLDDARMAIEWTRAIDRFLAGDARTPPPAKSGFFAADADNIRALEALGESAASLGDMVRSAREMQPMVHIFLASSLRAKNLFGRRNRTRDRHLELGLAAFANLDMPCDEAVTWLLPPTASPHAWTKVAEHLLDFIAFLGSLPEGGAKDADAAALARAYLESHRPQPAPQRLLRDGENRRRRD